MTTSVILGEAKVLDPRAGEILADAHDDIAEN